MESKSGKADRQLTSCVRPQHLSSRQAPAPARPLGPPAIRNFVSTLSRSFWLFLTSLHFFFTKSSSNSNDISRFIQLLPPGATVSFTMHSVWLLPHRKPLKPILVLHTNPIATIHHRLKVIVWISTSCCYGGDGDTPCQHLSIKIPLGLISPVRCLLRPDLLWHSCSIKA